MASVNELLRLCRLCLVKDEVHIPIFDEQGDIRQIFLKISACLPVKVSREDNLPKNICDSCSSKLESLYQFWNTSANSEKKLIQWLSAERTERNAQHSMIDPVVLKQEVVEVPDERTSPDHLDDLNVSNDADYLQQQLPYENVEFQFQQDDYEETVTDSVVEVGSVSRKRRAAAIRAIANMGSEDEGNPDLLEPKLAKIEEESEESGGEDPEPTAFVGLPSATDNDQPGPSGVCKQSADAPLAKKRKGRPRKLAIRVRQPTIKEEPLSECEDDVKFVCHVCKTEEKMTDEQLRRHFRELHKGKRLRSMKLHVENAIQCDVCPKFFRSLKSLKEHMETHSNQFNCEKCTAQFRKIVDYTVHLRLHSEEELFRCILCEFKTDSILEITDHLNNTHEKNHKYKCSKCAKGFHVQAWLQEHENYHSGEKPFACEFCGKNFPYSRYLIAHRNAIHKNEFMRTASLHECVICKKAYQHKNSLKLHMNVHTGNVSICDVCGRALSSKEKLKFHMRTHTGYKPFSCTYCGKCFTKKPILVEHERIHTGEKPYSCEFCARGFSQRSSLVIHMRGHTGERPYVCHLCTKGFVARAMLNIHFKTCRGME